MGESRGNRPHGPNVNINNNSNNGNKKHNGTQTANGNSNYEKLTGSRSCKSGV